ncbi:MAG: glycosyltransferase [Candidatus Eisenbacteria bacterium]|nr:glycosyltransferase [Candidatus Latescibacterota bacterium]MBD3301924.1 glycosyltransferase [Candidatus Eisenbacteria bacterium]
MKVGYVFTEVPQIAGMFPNAELDEMDARGLSLEIFILRNRPATTEEARRIEAKFPVHRRPYLLSGPLLRDFVAGVVRHPVLFLGAVGRIVRDTIGSPAILLRSLGVVPKSIHFAAEARRLGVDLLHAYWASVPATGASLISRFSGIPYTTWAHAGGDIYNRKRQTPGALRSRLREARLVFTCNSANPPYFEKLAGPEIGAKLHLISHGVAIDRFRPASDRGSRPEEAPPRILAVSRLSVSKGYDRLLEACRLLADRGHRFECWIAGTGILERALRDQAGRLGLEGTVRFLGHVDHGELPDLYRSADLFAMPSVIGPKGARDGLPNVLLEAMASGLACVGSNVASIPEVIADGETGLLVESGDVAALAAALERLLEDPALRARLGAAAVERIREEYARPIAMQRLYDLLVAAGSEATR